MYKKELKARFKKMVIRQADLANICCEVEPFIWNCLYYAEGLNDAAYVTEQYASYLPYIRYEDFASIFKSIVEFRKGVQ